MHDDEESTIHDSVAIIGMSGRLAGFDSVDEFWRGLVDGVDGSRTYTDDDLAAAGVPATDLADPAYVRTGYPLAAPGLFAAEFFDVGPAEAEVTDPQHRHFLECCWTAMEHAGRAPGGDHGRVGVFAAASASTHLAERVVPSERAARIAHPLQVAVGNDAGMLALRVAYKLNLTGPTLTVSSACSSSLVAVHLACQSLLTHECDTALAGGATVRQLDPAGYRHEEGGIVSRDGRCRPFDADATGTVAGDGVGVVVLKRLADALADGDHVHAVIRGSAVNNDGSAKVGITAPSTTGQVAVIRDALAVAGFAPETVDYVEAHGTGTALGDPIELRALAEALGTVPAGSCRVGAVKSSIGHLDVAAGVAGLIKTTLAIAHRFVPGTLLFRHLNPALEQPDSPFRITADGEPWPVTDHPPRAGVSSFGMGGTNVHLLLEAAPTRPVAAPNRAAQLLPLAARTADELTAAATRLADHLAEVAPGPGALADAAWTLQVGRARFAHRRAVVAADAAEAVAALRATATGAVVDGPPQLVFLFPGQGTRFAGVGAQLYASEPVFRAAVEECVAAFAPHLDWDLRALLVGPDAPESSGDPSAETGYAQPAMFCLDYACARLLRSWGIEPDAMVGHSLGELVAACLAGVFDLADAARVVAARARLMQELPAGRMVSVALAEEKLRAVLDGHGTIAAVNAPFSCVVAGNEAEMAVVERRLAEVGAVTRVLPVRRAFHTVHTEPALRAFADVLRTVRLRPPTVRFLSNLTGSWITDEQATDPQYWVAHVRGQVRFASGVAVAAAAPNPVFLEVGPGRGLGNLVRAGAYEGRPPVVALLAPPPGVSERRDGTDTHDEQRSVLAALAELWQHGVEVDWAALHGGVPRRRTPLPTYPFTRTHFLLPRSAGRPAAPPAGTPVWFPAALPRDSARVPERCGWLVLGDERTGGDDVAEALRAAGHPVRRITRDDGPDGDEGARPDTWERLVRDGTADGPVDRVLYGCDGGDDVDVDVAALVGLARALHASAPGRTVRVDVLTEQLREVAGSRVRAPHRAAVDGVATVLAGRYPGLRFHVVDVGSVTGEADRDRRRARLLAELAAAPDDTHVAYRGTRRFRRTLVPVPAGPTTVVADAGYLVTGADSETGLRLGAELARSGARVVLAGAPEAPDPTAPDASGPLAGNLARLLASRPGAVSWLPADPSDADGLRRLVDTARDRLGSLHGVLHVAGPPSGPEPDAVGKRVDRVRVLADLLAGADLDVLLLVTGVGGADPLTEEAVAAAVGAFAEYRTAEGWTTTAVHLRPGVDPDGPAGPAAVVRAALGGGVPQVVVTGPPTEVAGDAAPDGVAAGDPLPDATDTGDEVERTVAEVWREVLGVSGFGPEDDFYQLGGNSLFAMQIIARLRQHFGDLPMSVIFEAPTVTGLAAAIRVWQGQGIGLDEFEALLAEIEATPAVGTPGGGEHV
ncbi:beta-ketoacyl synthase N-terminal-like domain-containing protein [Micromonospora sp. NPDC023956]|uniref:type I polyketide synthase n=1 Tax=Micromonospora sp. NPDC023956 TaxID=3155722 RepID=UPI0033DE755D